MTAPDHSSATSNVEASPIEHGTVILCASARLAQGIRLWLQQNYEKQGLSQWQAPQVFPLQDWLNQRIEHALLCGQIDVAQAPQGMLSTTCLLYTSRCV